MRATSLFRRAQRIADAHKYIESQKAGHDLGATAIDDWQRRHWTLWLRHRYVEHLLGETCWEEFDVARFGRLRVLFEAYPELLDEVYNEVLTKLNIMLDENDQDEVSTPGE